MGKKRPGAQVSFCAMLLIPGLQPGTRRLFALLRNRAVNDMVLLISAQPRSDRKQAVVVLKGVTMRPDQPFN